MYVNSDNSVNTLTNDRELLEMMMKDMENAPILFQPTKYWKYHEEYHLKWLVNTDLNQFRSMCGGGNASFGASAYGDFPFHPDSFERMNPAIKMVGRILNKTTKYIKSFVFFNPVTISILYRKLRKTQRMLEELTYYCAELIDQDETLNKIEDSGLGNPTDLIVANGRKYTNKFLQYFSQYVYVKKFLDFDNINAVLEIGSGYGGQVEVLLKAHRHLSICIVDIPPQLYVAEQYLSACFPDQVYSYRLSRENKNICANIFDKYKIIVLAPWQLDDIKDMKFDLFWNSASFQEMEPEIVENYARYIQRLVSKWLYLRNQPEGSTIVPGREKNVDKQTRLEHYIRFFSDFELIDRSPAKVIPNVKLAERYDHMLFRRKTIR